MATESGPLPGPGAGNRLLTEQSKFLRNHAQDPVEWYPWGDEAFRKAQEENRLVMLSIGYAACPWSQRMQTESFQDPEVARFMNRHFVNVLIDREERPDVNGTFLHYQFYKSRQSGWPLHVWLTPRGLPVYSGVYFPKDSTPERVSWRTVIEHVANQWADDPDYIVRQAEVDARKYLLHCRAQYQPDESAGASAPGPDTVTAAWERLRTLYDPVNGGFGSIPKFPQPHSLTFLMDRVQDAGGTGFSRQEDSLRMVTQSLDAMLRGAIFDQLGGGFHRYCLDAYWAVPQFEKMLFDQAFLALTLVQASQLTGSDVYEPALRRVLAYADRELSHPEGGFYCAESSSSPVGPGATEFGEGAYYLWRKDEIDRVAGPEAAPVLAVVYDFDERGNLPIDSLVRSRFPDLNIPVMRRSVAEAAAALGITEVEAQRRLDEGRARLLAAREKRPRPLLDDKVVASWNGIAVSAFTRAAAWVDDPALQARAERAASFVLDRMRTPDGRLVHAWLDGPSSATGYLEDYALVISGLLDLYETTGSARWLQTAIELQDRQIADLWDPRDGGFFDGPQHDMLFHRLKTVDESSEFSPGAVSLANLIRLSLMLDRKDYTERIEAMLKLFGPQVARMPIAHLRFLGASQRYWSRPARIVVTGHPESPERRALVRALHRAPRPNAVILYCDAGESAAVLTAANPALADIAAADTQPAVHVLSDGGPVTTLRDPAALTAWLRRDVSGRP